MAGKNQSRQGKPIPAKVSEKELKKEDALMQQDERFLEAVDNQEKGQKKKEVYSVRGIDRDLYREARAQAIKEYKTIGVWLNEAIRAKLQINK